MAGSRGGARLAAFCSWRLWWGLGEGRAGLVLLFGGRPCDHAATSSSSSSTMACPSPLHRQSGGLSCCATASCSHSANCAENRRNSPGAVLGLVVDVPVLVQRQVRS